MTRAELHAQYFNLICDQSSHQSSPETVGLQQAATLLRKMQAAIEGAQHADECAIHPETAQEAPDPQDRLMAANNVAALSWNGVSYKCDCWKAPFL